MTRGFTTKTTRQLIQAHQDALATRKQRRLNAELAAEAAANRAAGLLPHRDSDDPWGTSVLRPCEPGCDQHPQAI